MFVCTTRIYLKKFSLNTDETPERKEVERLEVFFILTCAFPTCQNVLCEKRLLSNRTSLDDCPIFLSLAFILSFFCAILLTLLTLKYSRE